MESIPEGFSFSILNVSFIYVVLILGNILNNNFSVIVFDLGNVLIPFDHSIWIKKLNELKSGLGDSFYGKFTKIYSLHRDFERGALPKNDFIKTMLNWVENKLSSEEFCVFYSDIFTVNEKVVNLLPQLKQNYKLVLLSNTNEIHREYGWAKYEFLDYFDKLILSYEVGANKPEEKIYKAVEEFTNEKSSKHIFIDDIEEYVNGAKRLGWDGIQFSGYENLTKELKLRNIL